MLRLGFESKHAINVAAVNESYLAGENEENIKPRYPLSQKLANVENIVKSFGISLTQSSNVSEPCNICGKLVNNKKKHMKSHNPEQHKCPLCPIILTRADNLKRHLRMKHCSALMSDNFANIKAKYEVT